jgi:long-chain acyl-CoA synthetase
VGSGSAPLPASVLTWYRDIGLELLEGYGMSENFSYSHISLPGRSRHGYVGHPLPEVEQRIGEQQEIQIRSPGHFMGYFKEPDKTAETYTADGWLRTGDMGEIDTDGRLRITGRLKEVFKTSKGKYVVPAPIENKFLGSPHIEVVCVIGANQAQPLAVVVLSPTARESADKTGIEQELSALLSEVNSTLDGHEQLSHLVLVKQPWSIANGLLTPTLKVKRQAVERYYDGQLVHWLAVRHALVWEQ